MNITVTNGVDAASGRYTCIEIHSGEQILAATCLRPRRSGPDWLAEVSAAIGGLPDPGTTGTTNWEGLMVPLDGTRQATVELSAEQAAEVGLILARHHERHEADKAAVIAKGPELARRNAWMLRPGKTMEELGAKLASSLLRNGDGAWLIAPPVR